ncbi:MAG: hypothetical protein ACE5K1_09925 [Acidiferrobacterales bacterium]
MGIKQRLSQVLVALMAVLMVPAATAEAPVIMVLEHLRDGERMQTEIEAIPDVVVNPHGGKGQPKWAILPGWAIDSPVRPGDRFVHLFRQIGLDRNHLCTINIRYFKDKQGLWIPHFQLNQEPLLVRKNGRWVPLQVIKGIPTLIVLTHSTLPNAEGYFPSLEFGLTNGLTQIDFWVVR